MNTSSKICLGLGMMLPLLWVGCQGNVPHVDHCADVPPGAIPQPLGSFVQDWSGRQTAKARIDEFVVYLYEWQKDSTVFGPFGARHIEQIALRLPSCRSHVILEPDDEPGLNEARRATVVRYLADRGISDAPQRVVMGYPQAEGLYGDEAPKIYQEMIQRSGNQNQSQIGASNNNISSNFGNSGVGGAGFGTSGIGGQIR